MATSIKISDELKHRVHHLATQQRRSSHWIMHEAIRQYVEREEAQASFQREAEESWAAYQETGLHLTGEEVRDWLRRWGSAEETAVPACHE